MGKKIQTDLLFAQPSGLAGAARIVDIWAEFDDYNRSQSPAQADGRAIASDWLIVGQDIYDALGASEPVTESEVTAA